MKISDKKIPKRILAAIISLLVLLSMAPISMATQEKKTIINENKEITGNAVISADEVWEIADGITVTVSAPAQLTLNGIVILDGNAKIVTETRHDDKSNKDITGSVKVCGGAYIKGGRCIFGYEESYKLNEETEVSPVALLGEGTVVTIQTVGSEGSDVRISAESADKTPKITINGAYRLGKEDKLTVAENTEITAVENSVSAAAGAEIYNASANCASLFNSVENAAVYHFVTVKDATGTNGSKYVKNGSDYTVSTPEGKYISNLTKNGAAVAEAQKESSYALTVEAPVNVAVDFEDIPDSALTFKSVPKYVVKNQSFDISFTTNRDADTVKIDGTAYKAGNENVTRTASENGIYNWTVKGLSTAATKTFNVEVADSHFGSASSSFEVTAVEPITLNVSAKRADGKPYGGEYVNQQILFSFAVSGGIPAADGSPVKKVFCSDNGTDFSEIIGETYAADKSGTYTFYAEDAAGNKTEAKSVEVKIDKTAPELIITGINENEWFKEVEVTVESKDDESGIKNVYYKNEDGIKNTNDNTQITTEGGKTTLKVSKDVSKDHKFTFYAIDKVGNKTEIVKYIYIDNDLPTVNVKVQREHPIESFIDIITGGIFKVNSTSYTATVTAEDKSSGMGNLKLYIAPDDGSDAVINETTLVAEGQDSATYKFADLDTGKYRLYTVAVDKVGNEYTNYLKFENSETDIVFDVDNSDNKWTFTLTSDNQEVEMDKTDNIYYVSKNFEFKAIASNMTKIDLATVSYNSAKLGTDYTVNQYDEETGFVFDANIFADEKITEFPDGRYDFTFITSEGTETRTVIKDSSEPEFTVSCSNEDKYTVNKTLTVTVDDTKLISGVKSVQLFCDGKEIELAFTAKEDGQYVATITENGTYTVTVTSKTDISKTSAPLKVEKIYANAPALTVKAETEGGSEYKSGTWTNKNVVIKLSVNEDDKGTPVYKILRDNGEYEEVTPQDLTVETNTDKTFTFKAVGENGAESKRVELTVKIDKEAPIVTDLKINELSFLEKIFSKESAKVTVTVEDSASGISEIALYSFTNGVYKLIKDSNDNDCNKTYSGNNPSSEKVEFSISESTSNIAVYTRDALGNSKYTTTGGNIIIDENAPTVEINAGKPVYSDSETEVNYFNSYPTATVTVTEENFAADKTTISVTDFNGNAVDSSVSKDFTVNGYKYSKTVELKADGDYKITAASTDLAGNTTTKTYKMSVDTTKPDISISYDRAADNQTESVKYYKNAVSATITVTEHNFDTANSVVKVTDANGNPVDESAYSIGNWVAGKNDKYSINVSLKAEANYKIAVTAKDVAVHFSKAEYFATVDNTAPTCEITYSADPVKVLLHEITLGLLFKDTVTVTVKASDTTSGVAGIKYSIVEEFPDGEPESNVIETKSDTVSFDVNAVFRGKIVVTVTDRSQNDYTAVNSDFVKNVGELPDGNYNEVTLAVDESTQEISDIILIPDENVSIAENGKFINGAVTAEFKITDVFFVDSDVKVNIKKTDENGQTTDVTPDINWTSDGLENTADIKLTDDGDYMITVDYTDGLGNKASQKSAKFTIDKTAPVITSVTYDKSANCVSSKTGISYFSADAVTATVKIKEHNFDAENSVITVLPESKKVKASEWTPVEGEADVYSATVTFTEDENYSFSINSKDYANNQAAQVDKLVTLDDVAPTVTVTYSTNPIKAFFNNVTLGLFFKDTVEVTVSANDVTAGIRSIKTSGELEIEDSIDTALAESESTCDERVHDFSKTISIEPQYRGTLTAVVTDYATNSYTTTDKDITANAGELPEGKYDNVEIVVDNILPVIDVEFSSEPVYTGSETAISYYNKEVTATVTVEEHNFNADDSIIEVTAKDVDGKDVAGEDLFVISEWETSAENADIHIAKVEFSGDANYTLNVKAADYSGNKAETGDIYATVDKTAPVITSVTYDKSANNVSETTGISYFSANAVTATVKIKEHNFDAKNSVITVLPESKKVKASEWTPVEGEADVYSATVTFTEDENYSFSINSKDYANNQAAQVDKLVTLDDVAPTVTVTYSTNPIKAFFNNVTLGLFFKDTVEVTVSANDVTAGIRSIKTSGELEIEDSIDTALAESESTCDERVHDFSKTISIEPQYRGTLTAVVTDYATNSYTTTDKDITANAGELPEGKYDNVEIVVDNILPVIDVKFDSEPVYISSDTAISYYNKEVTATVTVEEHNFNAKDSKIEVIAKDVDGKEVTGEGLYVISEWATNAKNADIYTATVKFSGDANYTLNVKAADYSGNEAETGDIYATVDKTAPVLEVSNIVFSKVDYETTANTLLNYESYQHFFNGEIRVTVSASDATSGVKALSFYAVDYSQSKDGEVKKITPSSVAQGEKNGTMSYSFNMPANFKGNIYAQAIDYSTNKSDGGESDGYTKSKGLVVEDLEKHESIALSTQNSIIPGRKPNANGFYNADLPVKLCISDEYSGINNIKYTVGSADPVSIDLSGSNDVTYDWSQDVVLNAVSNNNNNVPVILSYIDNAGNPHETRTSFKVEYKIDVTAPVIDVKYNNNSVANGKYFNAARTVTVKITELNFKASEVVFNITKDGQAYKTLIPSPDKWKNSGIEHTVSITFAQDGDYTFGVSYTDLAGNKNNGVNYGSSAVPTAFTIDNIDPVVIVTYDNISSTNGNYYKAGRVATVTVHEHNFDATKSIVSVTAKTRINGTDTTVPAVSAWRNTGKDTYTATINFTADAYYSLDVAVNDLSGRAAAKFTKEEFTVDKTNPTVSVTDIVHQSANKKNDIRPVVTVNDTNINAANITIVLSGAKNGEVFRFENGSVKKHSGGYGSINNTDTSFRYAFDNIKGDDIYTLSIVSTDMSGNQNKFISAMNGGNHFVDLASNAMMFSVNRNGSTYMLRDTTQKVVNDYYVKAAPTLVVTEINADVISNYEITVGAGGSIKALTEGKDFSVNKYKPGERNYSGSVAKWYENTYVIFNSNFTNDQRYDVNLSSKDLATNENTTIGRCQISFCLDTQNPTGKISADGMNSHNSINAEKAVIKINVNDSNCDIGKCIITLDGKQLSIKDVNDKFVVYDGSIKIGEYDSLKSCFVLTITNSDESLKSAKHEIKFIAVDKVGHQTELDSFDFTLSTNFWILFYTNTPAFIGSIVGVVAVITAVVLIIIFKRKKSDNEQEQF